MLKCIGRNLAYWDEGDGVVFHILGGKDTMFKDSSSRCISALEKLVSKYPTYLIQFCSTESSYAPVIRCALGRNETLHLVNPDTCAMFSYSPLSDDFICQEVPIDYTTQTKLRTTLSHPPTLVVAGSCLFDTVLKAGIPSYFVVCVKGAAAFLFGLEVSGNRIIQALSNRVLAVYTVVPIHTLFKAIMRLEREVPEDDYYTSLLALSKVRYVELEMVDHMCGKEVTESQLVTVMYTVNALSKFAKEIREKIDPSYRLHLFLNQEIVKTVMKRLEEAQVAGTGSFLSSDAHEVHSVINSTRVHKSFVDYTPPATYSLCDTVVEDNYTISVVECDGVAAPLSTVDLW